MEVLEEVETATSARPEPSPVPVRMVTVTQNCPTHTTITDLAGIKAVIEMRAVRAEAVCLVCADLFEMVANKEAVERRALKAETEHKLCREFLDMIGSATLLQTLTSQNGAAASKTRNAPMPRRERGRWHISDEYLLSYLSDRWQDLSTLSTRANVSLPSATKRYAELAHSGHAERADKPVRYRRRGSS